jgi:WD40 repeat protein
VFSAGSDGKIVKWDITKLGSNFSKIDSMGIIHKALALSPDGKSLAVGGDYSRLYLYDAKTGARKTPLNGKITETWFLAYTFDGKGLISGGTERKVYYWDQNGGGAKEIHNSDSKINAIATSPIENLVVLGKSNGKIEILDLNTNLNVVLHNEDDNIAIVSLAFSRDGRYLAAGTEKGLVKRWDMKNKTAAPQVFRGHKARVNYIRFNHDNTRLATGSFDHTVSIWNMEDPTDPPIILKDHQDWVWSIEFTPDGNKLLAGCKDGKIRVWPTTIDQMSGIICDKTDRNLTTKEWEQFVGKDVIYESTCLKVAPSKK